MESFNYQLCVAVVVCEYDGLTNTLTILHLQTLLHQVLQNCIYGLDVEYITENLRVSNITSRRVVVNSLLNTLQGTLILPYLLHLLLLLIRQVVVFDTLLQNH